MRDFIFEHYVNVAQISIGIAFGLTLGTALLSRSSGKLQAVALAAMVYLAIVALGTSSDIKHLSPIGVAHALIAFGLAGIGARYLAVRAAWPLFVPCVFIAVAAAFNLGNEDVGLELMGRWNDSG